METVAILTYFKLLRKLKSALLKDEAAYVDFTLPKNLQ